MADFLSEFSKAQADFAQKCVEKFAREFAIRDMKSRIGEALFVALVAEVKSDMLRAMDVFAHWLACKLVRSNNFAKQDLPAPDQKSMVWMQEKSGVRPMYLAVFIALIFQPNTKLPLLGKITQDGKFIPNKTALEQYKACFNWGGKVLETASFR